MRIESNDIFKRFSIVPRKVIIAIIMLVHDTNGIIRKTASLNTYCMVNNSYSILSFPHILSDITFIHLYSLRLEVACITLILIVEYFTQVLYEKWIATKAKAGEGRSENG